MSTPTSADSIVIVTKRTEQVYDGGTTVPAKGTVLSINEIDGNFINLKQGMLDLEAYVGTIEDGVGVDFTDLEESLTQLITQSIGLKANVNDQRFTGYTRVSTPNSEPHPLDVINYNWLVQHSGYEEAKSKVNSSLIGNQALYNAIQGVSNQGEFTEGLVQSKANKLNAVLEGTPALSSDYDFWAWDAAGTYIPNVYYVKTKLQNLTESAIKPWTIDYDVDLGASNAPFDTLYIKGDIIPTEDTVSLGSASKSFRNIFINENIFPTTNGDSDLGQDTKGFGDIFVARSITPTTSTVDIGDLSHPIREMFISDRILPTNTTVDLGSPSRPFRDMYLSGNTLRIGGVAISSEDNTLIMPSQTAIGDEENVIPTNFASTFVDTNFAQLQNGHRELYYGFVADGDILEGDAVAINIDGTISAIRNSAINNQAFIGIAKTDITDGQEGDITVHGFVSYTLASEFDVSIGNTIYVETDGTITNVKSATTEKIGTIVSSNEVFVFSTSKLDTYLLNYKKAELKDISVSNESTASGPGDLSYNSTTGEFTYTPVDLSTYATQTYVTTQISNLVDGAPSALDTLNELAAALNDDDEFAATVTNALALKAPIHSPVFTGTPTATLAPESDNTTRIATTSFVKRGLDYKADLASPVLTGTPTAPTAASGTNSTQIATTAYVQTEIADHITLTDLSIAAQNSPSGNGSISYNSSTGEFTYTPPSLTAYVTEVALTDLTDVNSSSATQGQILTANSDGTFTFEDADAVTFDGAFSSLTGTPTTISGYGITDAFDGAFSSLTGKPTTISGYGITDAFDGSYESLTDVPATFTPSAHNQTWSTITNTPTTISGYGITDAFDGAYSSLTGTPSLATVATSGSYNDLSNLPSLFSGSYTDLTNKPTLFSGSYNDLTDTPTLNIANWNLAYSWGDHSTEGYITGYTVTESDVTAHEAALTITESQISDLQSYLTSVALSDLTDVNYSSGTTGQVLTLQSDGTVSFEDSVTSGDLAGYATESYVDTAVSNLIDSAPGTLDTLNELAAAINDDANFASTITTSIGTKWTQDNTKISNWDTAYSWGDHSTAGYITGYTVTESDVTAHEAALTITESQISDLSHFSGSYNDLTNKPTIPTNNSQLTNGAGYITGYTVTESDVTAHEAALTITESQISDLGNYLTSVTESDVTAHEAALTITESQISDLGNYLTSVSLNELFDVDASSGTTGQVLTVQSDGTYAFEDATGGSGGGASALNDLTDVSASSATTGQVLTAQSDGTFAFADSTGGSGGISYYVVDGGSASSTFDELVLDGGGA
jgi:hypothetical protein